MIFDNTQLKTELSSFLQQRFANFFKDLTYFNTDQSKEEVLGHLFEQTTSKPSLNIIQVGTNLASQKYANLKVKMGQKLGVETFYYRFEEVGGELLLWKNNQPWPNWQAQLKLEFGETKLGNNLDNSSKLFDQKNGSRLANDNTNLDKLDKLTNQQKIELFISQLIKSGAKIVENDQSPKSTLGQNLDSENRPDKLLKKLKSSHLPKNGLILQLPLPPEMADLPEKINWSEFADVDFLGEDQSKLWHWGLLPPTILAIDLVLKSLLATKDHSEAKNKTVLTSKIADKSNNLVVTDKIKVNNQASSSWLNAGSKSLFKATPSEDTPLQFISKSDLEPDQETIAKSEIEVLLHQKLDLSEQIVTIIGQGQLVGGPLLNYFQKANTTIISLNKDTPDKPALTQLANIVVCASGVPKLVQSFWLSNGVILIDAATSESGGVLVGDVDQEELQSSNLDVKLCPSPGGIGPLTVLAIFWNLYQLWAKELSDQHQ